MLQRYVFKYMFVCYLVLILVMNAIADISIDYYFGNEEPLRSIQNLENCKTEEKSNECRQRCGPDHACLWGQCFCATVIDGTQDSEEGLLGGQTNYGVGSESYEEDDGEELSSSSKSSSEVEQLEVKPALRHHIAHFCPNLKKARVCIRKCLKLGKPAFCGKDHNCYCGHQYEFPGKEPKLTASDIQGQFRDLYEKYFGPKHSKVTLKHKHRV